MPAPWPLAGLTVLEIADGPAGAFCGRQLSLWGADVIRLEPPDGGPLRQMAPSWRLAGQAGSIPYDFLTAGKQVQPIAALASLAGRADVILFDGAPAELQSRAALDLAGLRSSRPELVAVSITPFGLRGPRAQERADVLRLQALSGYLSLNGRPDGPPMPAPARLMEHAIGAAAFVGAMAALVGRQRHGRGDLVEISGLETLASLIMWVREQGRGVASSRLGGTPEGARLIRCRDGWVSVAPAVPSHLEAYREVLGLSEHEAPESLVEGPDLGEAADRAAAAFAPRAAQLNVDELMLGLQVRGVVCGKVQSPADLLADPQLAACDAFEISEHAAVGPLPFAGRPGRLAAAPAAVGCSSGVPIKAGAAPLTGLKVLDLTQAWIGPMAGMILADLGAELVKVEGSARPDVWRYLGQAPERPGAAATSPLNRSWYFNGANRGKRGLGLDLTRAEGSAAFLRLAAQADVVLENFTPHVMPRLGLDYARLAAVQPSLVMTSFSGLGPEGPFAGFKANGSSIEALAGWDALHLDAAGEPVLMGGYPADPICALQMAASTLVALYRRFSTGAGAHVEGSMLAAAVGYVGDAVLEASLAAAGAEISPPAPVDITLVGSPDRWRANGEPVRTTLEALEEPQLADWFIPLITPGLGRLRHPGPVVRLSDALAPASASPPTLGQHTREVLSEAGFTAAEIEGLFADGVAGRVP